ncbi:KTSC domain-containing protein [Georgenia sp. SYP-B2076]|uniref:KTSC domain-containing protein n=1 Tax=Georgenia sp. SYP-B2076 TaxID=2495881 RepID=UPI000F8E038E|nr:KTSC domain-containing protein [Georgenia sp. SYP-B2076]
MDRERVVSSTIVEVGYDPSSRTLELRFTGGRLYRYFDVPEQVFADMLAAPSKGRYFNREIRDGYRYVRVGRHG